MYNVEDLLSKIINDGYKVKINYRKVKENYVLFLNYRKMTNGEIKQETKRLATLTGDRKEDTEKVKRAISYRADFEKTIKKDKDVFKNKADEIMLGDYIDEMIKTYTNKNTIRNFTYMKSHVMKFANENISLSQIDRQFVTRFSEYLLKKVEKASRVYLIMFKIILYKAIDQELISDMPYLRKINIKYKKKVPVFLTEEEIRQVYHTPTKYEEYRDAFVFGCFTGLRYSDLSILKFTDIQADYIVVKQQKTGELVSIPLSETALEILERQKIKQKGKETVFGLSSYPYWARVIRRIIPKAGITQHISGHCARHSFASLLAEKDVSVLTIQNLLGHTDVRTTMIYTHLMDKKKVDAIKKLPKL